MLDTIRKKKNGLFISLVVFGVVLVMAFFGLGPLTGPSGGAGAPAAWVNGEVITRFEYQQELEARVAQYQQLLGNRFDESFIETLQIPQQTLNNLIQRKLLAQQAKKMGITISDVELASYIRGIPSLQKDGQFDVEAYRRIPNRGSIERRERESLQVNRLQQYLIDRVRPTPAELQRAYQFQETKLDLHYGLVDFSALTKNHQPKQSAIQAALKNTEAKRFERYYKENIKEFTRPGEVQLRQIRVGIPFQASEEKKASAKAKAEAIAKEVTTANFAKIAKAKSDDPYAKKGGLVPWTKLGTTLPKEIEAAVATLKKEEVRGPIETPFGYFVIQLVDKKEREVEPLEKAKPKIARVFAIQNYKDTFQRERLKQWDAKLAKGQRIDAELKRLKVEIKKTGPFSVERGFIPNVGRSAALLDAAVNLTKKQPIAKKLILNDGKYVYLRLAKITPPKTKADGKKLASLETTVRSGAQNEVIGGWLNALEKKSTIKRK